MRLLKILWKTLPIYALWNFLTSLVKYVKVKKYIGETFYSDALKLIIKKYLKIDLKEDWIGRLYGVANPNIKDGKYDISSMIIEIDGDNTNNEDQVKHWAYKQLNLIATLFKFEKLYDFISLEFKHVGPKEYDNYLFVFDMPVRKTLAKATKYLFVNFAIWGTLVTGFVKFICV